MAKRRECTASWSREGEAQPRGQEKRRHSLKTWGLRRFQEESRPEGLGKRSHGLKAWARGVTA